MRVTPVVASLLPPSELTIFVPLRFQYTTTTPSLATTCGPSLESKWNREKKDCGSWTKGISSHDYTACFTRSAVSRNWFSNPSGTIARGRCFAAGADCMRLHYGVVPLVQVGCKNVTFHLITLLLSGAVRTNSRKEPLPRLSSPACCLPILDAAVCLHQGSETWKHVVFSTQQYDVDC